MLVYIKKIIFIVQIILVLVLFTSCGQDSAKNTQEIENYISGTILKGKVTEGKVSVYQGDGTTLIGEDLTLENSEY